MMAAGTAASRQTHLPSPQRPLSCCSIDPLGCVPPVQAIPRGRCAFPLLVHCAPLYAILLLLCYACGKALSPGKDTVVDSGSRRLACLRYRATFYIALPNPHCCKSQWPRSLDIPAWRLLGCPLACDHPPPTPPPSTSRLAPPPADENRW